MIKKIIASRYFCPVFAVAAAILAAYPALGNGFIHFSDSFNILSNSGIKTFNLQNLDALFFGAYNPLMLLSFMADWLMGGGKPFLFHLTNFALHLANAVLLYYVFLYISKNRLASCITALLFAVYPANAQAVALLAERNDLLFAFFWNTALLCYFKYETSSRKKYYAFTLAALLFSLFSSPMAITFPVIILLVEWEKKGRLSTKSITNKWPFFALCFASALIAVYMLPAVAQSQGVPHKHWQLLFDLQGVVIYLTALIIPAGLKGVYLSPAVSGSALPSAYYWAPFILIALGALYFWAARKNRQALFGGLFFVITLFPAIALKALSSDLFFSHYTYIPFCGIFFIIGLLIYKIYKFNKWPAALIILCLVFYYGFASQNHILIFKNDITLFGDIIKNYPQSLWAYQNRANVYTRENLKDKALDDYIILLNMSPSEELYIQTIDDAIENGYYEHAKTLIKDSRHFYAGNIQIDWLELKLKHKNRE